MGSGEKTQLYFNVLLVIAQDIDPEKLEIGPTIDLQLLISPQSKAKSAADSLKS